MDTDEDTLLSNMLRIATRYDVPIPPALEPKDRYTVTANALSVRGGPGTQFVRLYYLSYGDAVEALDEVNGWAMIKPGEWVSMEFLRKA